MDEFMSEPENKDKQRALAEMLGGLLRGSKHWPGKARQKLWDWLVPRLPRLYADIRQETFEYVVEMMPRKTVLTLNYSQGLENVLRAHYVPPGST